MKRTLACFSLFLLAACGDDFTPTAKEARYDPVTGSIDLPHPCPDWSKPGEMNYSNSLHSNFGCAVNNNAAQQLAYPEDLAHGNPNATGDPDTEITAGVVDQYRAGKIPQPLTPLQSSGSSSQ